MSRLCGPPFRWKPEKGPEGAWREDDAGGGDWKAFVILTPRPKSVLMTPGTMQFTLMPFGASSTARDLQRPSRAVLLVL